MRPPRWLVLILVAGFASGLVWSSLRYILAQADPPPLAAEAPYHPPLTRRLLFVIVDGLRYDVATDPVRMPLFSRAMQSHTSAEIWCGPISMTASAIHAYGTGQSGGIEQVLANVRPRPPPFESWLMRAHGAGQVLALSGEPEWIALYGPYIRHRHLDPIGVPIGFDFNDQTFAGVRQVRAHSPNFLIAHFVTPDHQGHRWGIPSREYARHIHDFDRRLDEMLREFSSDWTVIVTSDHGATDSGTHGTDVEIQRRSPIYAYGPGIARNARSPARLEQIDLAGTMAVLLGAPPPRHSRGSIAVEWLDLSPAERKRIACADAERGLSYGEAAFGATLLAPARAALDGCQGPDAIGAARSSLRTLDATIASHTGVASLKAWLIVASALLATALIAGLIYGSAAIRVLPLAGVLVALSAFLVWGIERLPGMWPNVARVVLFTAASLGVLLALTRPRTFASWLEQKPIWGALAIPGSLLLTYPTNTQPMGLLAILACTWLLGDRLVGDSFTRFQQRRTLLRIAALPVIALLLWWPGTRASEMYPTWFTQESTAQIAASLAIAVWCLVLVARHGSSQHVPAAIGLVPSLASIALYPHASPLIGRSLLLIFALSALVAASTVRRTLALSLGLVAYVWLCRFWEIPVLVVTLLVADGVGRAISRGWLARGRALVIVLATFVFGMLFVQRVGIQGGIDLAGLDQTTAVFGDHKTPYWVAGTALVAKYALAALLVLGALLHQLPVAMRKRLMDALLVAYVARTAILIVMLVACGSSFWTAQRVLGDLPFAVVGSITMALMWAIAGRKFADPAPQHHVPTAEKVDAEVV